MLGFGVVTLSWNYYQCNHKCSCKLRFHVAWKGPHHCNSKHYETKLLHPNSLRDLQRYLEHIQKHHRLVDLNVINKAKKQPFFVYKVRIEEILVEGKEKVAQGWRGSMTFVNSNHNF